jgi:hypothetical protein
MNFEERLIGQEVCCMIEIAICSWQVNMWSCENEAKTAKRPQKVKDARNVECLQKKAADIRESQPERAAMWTATSKHRNKPSQACRAHSHHSAPKMLDMVLQGLMFALLNFGIALSQFLSSPDTFLWNETVRWKWAFKVQEQNTVALLWFDYEESPLKVLMLKVWFPAGGTIERWLVVSVLTASKVNPLMSS